MSKSEMITVAMPAGGVVLQEAPPVTVSQKTSERWFGIPPKSFLALCRTDAFRVTPVGHLRVASFEDVREALAARSRVHSMSRSDVEEADEADALLDQIEGRRTR